MSATVQILSPQHFNQNVSSTCKRRSLSSILNVTHKDAIKLANTNKHPSLSINFDHFRINEGIIRTSKKSSCKNSLISRSNIMHISNDNDSKLMSPIKSTDPNKIYYLDFGRSVGSSPSNSIIKSKKGSINNSENIHDSEFYHVLKKQKEDILNDKMNICQVKTPDYTKNLNKFFSRDTKIASNLLKLYNSYDKLPVKRQSLSKPVREAYSNVIKAKEVGEVNVIKFFPKTKQRRDFTNPERKLFFNSLNNSKNDENDEVSMISKIGANMLDSFKSKIVIYNRFYSNYLIEPDKEYSSLKDLHIKPDNKFPWLPQQTPLGLFRHDKKSSRANKVRNVNLSSADFPHLPDQNAHEIIESITPVDSTIQIKYDEINKNDYLAKRTNSSQNSKINIMNSGVLDPMNIKKLEGIGASLKKPGDLTKEEAYFLKLVKDGLENDVDMKLFKNSSLVNIRDFLYETPLHWAAKRGLLRIARILIKFKADVFAVDVANRTPKDLAVMNGHRELADILEVEEEKAKKQMRLHIKNQVFNMYYQTLSKGGINLLDDDLGTSIRLNRFKIKKKQSVEDDEIMN